MHRFLIRHGYNTRSAENYTIIVPSAHSGHGINRRSDDEDELRINPAICTAQPHLRVPRAGRAAIDNDGDASPELVIAGVRDNSASSTDAQH